MYVCSCVCLQKQLVMESPRPGVTCGYESQGYHLGSDIGFSGRAAHAL